MRLNVTKKMKGTSTTKLYPASMIRPPRFWAVEQWAVFGYLIALMSLGGHPRFTIVENIAGVVFGIVVGAKLMIRGRSKLPWSTAIALGCAFVLMAVFYVLLEGLGVIRPSGFSVRRLLTLIMTAFLGYLVFFTVRKFRSIDPIAAAIAVGVIANLALIFGSQEGVPVRVGGGLGQANLLGVTLAFGVALMLIAANQRLREGVASYIPVALFLVSGIALYITFFHSGSRTGMAAIGLLVLAFFANLFSKSPRHTKWLLAILGSVGLIYGLGFISFVLDNIWVRRMINLFLVYRGEELEVREGSVFVRIEMIQAAFKGWLEKPFFGHGFDSFRETAGWDTYSHSNFVELLYNHGAIGFILFYAMVFSVISLKGRSVLDMVVFNAGVAAILVTSFGSVIYYNKMFWVLIGAGAAMCAISRSERRNRRVLTLSDSQRSGDSLQCGGTCGP